MANFYNQTVKETLEHFSTNLEKGLTANEVAKRQTTYGKNSLSIKGTPLWRKLIEPFADIFMVILVVAMALSLIQHDWIEAIAIGVIIVADAAIYYIQRFSTERILRTLKSSTQHGVSVLRDGTEQTVDASNLVPGDIVILHEGDRIPADGRIAQESGLLTNEAMLTGESVAVAKDARAISDNKKVYEQRNMVFSGSFVVTGTGRIIVTATGNSTEYGRIASLASSVSEESPISQKINRLVFQTAIIVVILAAIVLVVQLLDRIDVFSALKFTLAMVVSAVPEGLPIAISIILALSAKRMARKKALIKELKAIESIGIVTTIASDKTGTLTENRLELKETWSTCAKCDFRDALARATLLQTAIVGGADSSPIADPLDVCLLNYLQSEKVNLDKLIPLRSYVFDQGLKLSGNLYSSKGELLLFVKGAPEVILSRSKLKTGERELIEAHLLELAGKGYKVLAVATGKIKHEINELTRLDKDDNLQFIGLFGVADALRPEAAPAIRQALRMGVKTKMVTGDHATTAFAIGKELGLTDDVSEVLDCSKLGSIRDNDLAELTRTTTVFARVTPEDKYRILTAMKQHEICAMTGDGVNDVPALVGAHVGIAMGDSPSIVQDAGDIILLDNNFKNIIEAIRESRTVLANIRRMLGYLLATNAGEALTMVTALLLFGSQMLTPIQILWVNLATDSLLVIPLGLEPPEPKVLRRRPESKDAAILPANMILRMIIIAVMMAAITVGTYSVANFTLHSAEQANTLAFTALVVMQWSSALAARGTYESVWQRLKVRHTSFMWALVFAVALQVVVIFTPLKVVVGVVTVPALALVLTSLAAFFIPLIVIETYKKFQSQK